jgi:hypothetical protein
VSQEEKEKKRRKGKGRGGEERRGQKKTHKHIRNP